MAARFLCHLMSFLVNSESLKVQITLALNKQTLLGYAASTGPNSIITQRYEIVRNSYFLLGITFTLRQSLCNVNMVYSSLSDQAVLQRSTSTGPDVVTGTCVSDQTHVRDKQVFNQRQIINQDSDCNLHLVGILR